MIVFSRDRLERAQAGLLYALLILLPFSKAAVEIIFGLLLLAWALAWLDPQARQESFWRGPQRRTLRAALLVFLGVCALSIAVSSRPAESLLALVAKWSEYLLYAVMVADLTYRRPAVARRSLIALVIAVAAVLVEALTQELWGRGLFRRYPRMTYGRMTGPYENPVDLATYLIVVLPVVIVAAASAGRRARPWLWGMVLVICAALARTLAQSAWFAAALALGYLGWTLPALRARLAVLIGVAAVLSAGVLAMTGMLASAVTVVDAGAKDRWFMWQAALRMIHDRPFLGHGLNTFMGNYLNYWVGGEHQPRYAHNCYLQMAAETGLIGLAAFLALLGLLVARMMRAARGAVDAERMRLAGLTAGVVAFLIHAGLDTGFYALRHAALFWVLAGLTLGASEQALAAAAGSRAARACLP